MNRHEQIIIAVSVFEKGLGVGFDIPWCKKQIDPNIYEASLSLALNGMFGKDYIGEA